MRLKPLISLLVIAVTSSLVMAGEKIAPREASTSLPAVALSTVASNPPLPHPSSPYPPLTARRNPPLPHPSSPYPPLTARLNPPLPHPSSPYPPLTARLNPPLPHPSSPYPPLV
jgi:hypothetical protein